ncbi:MAG: Rpn family recombination-promoting nuclease/putative transposase [Fibromonadaceae bacterium]|nr:Rpn family recombination-promoting nuclease/putative transposase [Fibromonadaceae bacterium]
MSKDREIISFDYAMKDLLRQKANFVILEGFLTTLLNRKVKVMEILESEGNKEYSDDKVNRIDIKAKIDGSEIAIIEIQYADMIDFFGKMLFNVGRAIVEQIREGGKYNVKKIYVISIAYFDLGATREYLFNAKMEGFKGINFGELIPFAQIDELAHPKSISKDIHPEYFLILPKKFDEKIRSQFDQWIYTLKKSVVKSDFDAPGIKEAGKRLDMLKMTDVERKSYLRHLENIRDVNCSMDTYFAKGKVEGEALGEARGEARGIEKGKAEEKLELAKKMKTEGMGDDVIYKITGLSEKDFALKDSKKPAWKAKKKRAAR